MRTNSIEKKDEIIKRNILKSNSIKKIAIKK
jgi:hypothetical protein